MFRIAAAILTASAALVSAARSAEPEQIKSLLAHPIIGPQVSMAEVQQFAEVRVPKMPTPTKWDQWHAEADTLRQRTLDEVVYRGEAAAWRDAQTRVEWLDYVDGGPGYRIRKLRYEALPGLWIPALLYEPEKLTERVPAVLNVNGHDGKGKAAPYKQIRCINLAKRGMLALNVEWLNMGQLRGEGYSHYRMNQLDLCGTSGLAPFYLSMKRGLDVLMSLEHTDSSRIAVAGLSGGGWQTIFISSLDTRVSLSNPVAGYSSFVTRARHLSDLGDSEQTPSDLATVVDYKHLTAMLAPRGALLTYNIKDNCCFASDHALPPLMEAAEPIYKLYEAEKRLRSHINHDPGTHNFERDNREAFYRTVGDTFFAEDKQFDATEIASDEEVKTAEELHVPLPEANADFHSLAMKLAESLPREGQLPTDETAVKSWQSERRARLKDLLKAEEYQTVAEAAGDDTSSDIKAQFWRLRMGDAWTVPAVELSPVEPQSTTIVVADAGRQSASAEIGELVSAGHRIVALDPFYFGESKIAQKDHLFALLVAAVGQRPLGIQASQVASTARWIKSRESSKQQPVRVVAMGPRSSLFVLVAAALEPEAIDSVELRGAYGSLKEILEQNQSVDKAPELFAFGLLQDFDIKQLTALVAPRKATFPEASDRVKRELAELAAFYKRTKGELAIE
jgi:hypothetical protein